VDNNDLHTPTGHIAVGWLVVEDLLTVLLLVVLPVLFGPGSGGVGAFFGLLGEPAGGLAGLSLAVALSFLKIGALVALIFLLGGRLIPWVLGQVAATRSRELFTLAVLALALGVAVGSAALFGVSMALGAFLAGMVVCQSEFGLRAGTEALPMRDAFAVLFFVSVGMLLDPAFLVASPGLVAATLAIILLGKPLAALAIVLALGYSPRVALSVAVALAQIGEFSFILAGLGRSLGILGEGGPHALVAAAIVSISLNPLLYRLIPPFERWAKRGRLWTRLEARANPLRRDTGPAEPAPASQPVSQDRAVVVGYGPTGRQIARLLEANRITPVVVELNLKTVRKVREAGITAVYGDAGRRETLAEAGVEGAVALILAVADLPAGEETLRLARELNPCLRIIARATTLRDIPALRRAGADAVFSGEGEVALNMTEFLLRLLGATAEQIDRERQRVRAELSGDAIGGAAPLSGQARACLYEDDREDGGSSP
jgi:CPA2 family monovalent cation:H+ antiporter-2